MTLAKIICAGACLAAFAACGASDVSLPPTLGELASNYGYVPLDPLAVDQTNESDSCKEQFGDNGPRIPGPLLDALPDIAIRFAVAEVSVNGGLNFGPAKTTAAGNSYRAVLDYINADVVPVTFVIRKRLSTNGTLRWVRTRHPLVEGTDRLVGYEALTVSNDEDVQRRGGLSLDDARTRVDSQDFDFVTVPVYIGIGLRMSADFRALKGGIDLSGLSVIGTQVEAKALTGTLAVQTLGVTGRAIALALPLPNKLDQTTLENAVLAMGASRAILYHVEMDKGLIAAAPRVVGLYSPVGSDAHLVNAIYTELSKYRPKWPRRCVNPQEASQTVAGSVAAESAAPSSTTESSNGIPPGKPNTKIPPRSGE